MKNLVFTAILAISLAACNSHNQDMGHHHRHVTAAYMDSLREDLLKTDIAFSKMSEEKGRNAAFTAYAATEVTSLRPFSDPVTGSDFIKSLNASLDTGIVVTWVPISADVARSGELGFTYGTYSLDRKNAGHEAGTYCTVWHKDSTKAWKYILETSNDGLSPKEKSENTKADTKK